jgi:curved DNA-binding protein CbpA
VRDPYEVLGVPSGATPRDVQRAYRAAALRHHPDRSPAPDAAARFAEVSSAYQLLRDPERRRAYDARRAAFASAGAPLLRHVLEVFGRQLGGAGSRSAWDGDTLLVEGGGLRFKIRLGPA